MDKQVSVKIENLFKSYKDTEKKDIKIEVLRNISFEVKEGEKVGIIGRNGAGKSTLLNIMSQYAKPDSGNILIDGKVNAILDIGTNLKPELTGRENVEQIGSLYGFQSNNIEEMLKEIEEFVDIGDYWDRPIKTYSSGMKARVAFAQIAFIQPEILIIDEVLGVGDYQFVEKSRRKIEELCNRGKILFIVSHALETIKNMTNRCIWLEHGEIVMDDVTEHVVNAYEEFINNYERERIWEIERNTTKKKHGRKKNDSYIECVCITNGIQKENIFQIGEGIFIKANVVLGDLEEKYDLKLIIEDCKGNIFLENYYSEDCGATLEFKKKKKLEISTVVENINFSENVYVISLILIKNGAEIDKEERVFRIIDHKKEYYSFPLGYTISVWDITHKEEHIRNEHIWENSRGI